MFLFDRGSPVYLLISEENEVFQVQGELTDGDRQAVNSGSLSLFRFRPGSGFEVMGEDQAGRTVPGSALLDIDGQQFHISEPV